MSNLANHRMGCALDQRAAGVAFVKAGDVQGARRAFSSAHSDYTLAAEIWETSNCHAMARACRRKAYVTQLQIRRIKD